MSISAIKLKSFLVAASIVICALCEAQTDVELSEQDQLIYKDSVGNFLSKEKALKLLRTGKYISVPAMNGLMQVEQTIRRPTKEDGDRHQIYTDNNTVIGTTGLKKLELKYNLGDTLPDLKVSRFYGEQPQSLNELANDFSALLFYQKSDMAWQDAEPSIKNLVADYPSVNFIMCAQDEKSTLPDFFDKRTLKLHHTIFLAENSFTKKMSVSHFPEVMIVDRAGKLLIFTPPVSKQEILFSFLKNYLSSVSRKKD